MQYFSKFFWREQLTIFFFCFLNPVSSEVIFWQLLNIIYKHLINFCSHSLAFIFKIMQHKSLLWTISMGQVSWLVSLPLRVKKKEADISIFVYYFNVLILFFFPVLRSIVYSPHPGVQAIHTLLFFF